MDIALLCSGGVDSALAMYLLKEEGHNVTAYYLKIWIEDEWEFLVQGEGCPWQEDLKYIEKNCDFLGIPYHVIPFQQEYKTHILSYMLEQVQLGYTPNPDLLCNRHIKFGVFIDLLEKKKIAYRKIATGHYASVVHESNTYKLLSSIDSIKDQSYFLSRLTQEQLSKALFPLGALECTKEEVRKKAIQLKLPAAKRPDSQGLCFLGKINFSTFLERNLGTKPGPLICADTGKVLGEHKGYWFYTIGQRQGLGLGNGPWYVTKKEVNTNTVFISNQYYAIDSETKKRDSLKIHQYHWINQPLNLEASQNLEVKLRHGPKKYKCQVKALDADSFFVSLDGRDQGIAPGQFAVFYEGRTCLGCGVIME